MHSSDYMTYIIMKKGRKKDSGIPQREQPPVSPS